MLMAAVNDLPVVAKALIAGNADVNQARASAKAVPYVLLRCMLQSATGQRQG